MPYHIYVDESNLSRDRMAAAAVLAPLDPDIRPTYDHLHTAAEPLLWLPDLVAWAWSKNGSWRHLMAKHRIDVRTEILP